MTTKKSDKNSEEQSTRRTRADGRETAQRILEFAEKELVNSGLVNFNLERVIEQSGVARSSVYHHFAGRDGVIAAVETEYLRASLDAGMNEMIALLSTVTSGEEAFALVELGVLVSGSDSQKATRRRRISTLDIATNSPATMEMLSRLQASGTSRFADIIRDLRDRELCNPIEPIDGTAHLIQSILLGRILVDIIGDPMAESQWTQSATSTLRHLLRPCS